MLDHDPPGDYVAQPRACPRDRNRGRYRTEEECRAPGTATERYEQSSHRPEEDKDGDHALSAFMSPEPHSFHGQQRGERNSLCIRECCRLRGAGVGGSYSEVASP